MVAHSRHAAPWFYHRANYEAAGAPASRRRRFNSAAQLRVASVLALRRARHVATIGDASATCRPDTESALSPAETDSPRAERLARAIVRTLAYADLFDFPLRSDEVWRQLLLETATFDEVETLLHNAAADAFLASRVGRDGAYFTLAGRSGLAERRRTRQHTADRLIADHVGVLGLVSMLPWVRMVAFSGGTSRRNSIHDDDIDLFIVAEQDRVWSTFLGLVVLARAAGCRDILCANYLIDRTNIVVPDGGDLFTGQELLGLEPLSGRRQLERMAAVNEWTQRLLPNAGLRPRLPLFDDGPWRGRIQRGVEWAMAPAGWAIEGVSRRALGWHLSRKQKRATGGDMLLRRGMLKLHQSDNRASIVSRFRAQLDALDVAGDDLDVLLEPRRRKAAAP
jgi:hypothetical protein